MIDGVGEWSRSKPSDDKHEEDVNEASLVGIGVEISKNPKYGTSSSTSHPARTHTSSISVMMNP